MEDIFVKRVSVSAHDVVALSINVDVCLVDNLYIIVRDKAGGGCEWSDKVFCRNGELCKYLILRLDDRVACA